MDKTKYIELFKNYQKDGTKESTIIRKLQIVRKFLDYLEGIHKEDLSDIEKQTVYDFLNDLNYRPQTISYAQFTLRNFFNIMHSQEITSFDGSQLFPVIKTDKRDSILSYYAPEEIKTMVEGIDTTTKCGVRDKCMVLIAAECGLRAGDIVWLKFNEVNWDKKLITKVQQKTGISIIVPFTERVLLLLLDYLKNHRPKVDSEYIFINTTTNASFTSAAILTEIVQKNFRKSDVEKKNRKYGSHALRHSLATTMLLNNTPVPVITGVLGHVSSKTTQKYLSIDVEGLRKVSLEVPE